MLKRIYIIVILLSYGTFIYAQNKTYDGCEISYDNLRAILYDASPHHYLSPFVNLDISFPDVLLQLFLQTEMDLYPHDENCKWVSSTHWQLEFGPGIILGNEKQYIQLHYYLKPTINVPTSSIPTKKGTCSIIEKCEIIGTPDLILKLFVRYWGEPVIGGQKIGEIANTYFMGDKISLYATSNNLFKIIITDNNNFDYKSNFANTTTSNENITTENIEPTPTSKAEGRVSFGGLAGGSSSSSSYIGGGNGTGPGGTGGSIGNRKVTKVMPVFKDNLTGTVKLKIMVNEEGIVEIAEPASGTTCSECVPFAIKAVKQWKYEAKPGSGTQTGIVTVEFKLK